MKNRVTASFLLTAWDTDYAERFGRLPAGTDIEPGEDGDPTQYIYVWSCTAAKLETCIRRAARRCQSLRNRVGLQWCIGEELERHGSKRGEFVYIGNHPLLRKLDLLH